MIFDDHNWRKLQLLLNGWTHSYFFKQQKTKLDKSISAIPKYRKIRPYHQKICHCVAASHLSLLSLRGWNWAASSCTASSCMSATTHWGHKFFASRYVVATVCCLLLCSPYYYTIDYNNFVFVISFSLNLLKTTYFQGYYSGNQSLFIYLVCR